MEVSIDVDLRLISIQVSDGITEMKKEIKSTRQGK